MIVQSDYRWLIFLAVIILAGAVILGVLAGDTFNRIATPTISP